MNCEACGHDWFDHGYSSSAPVDIAIDFGLCEDCFHEPKGGPCFPWEFR